MCNHTICDDLRTGTRVCINCGKVFDVILLDGQQQQEQTITDPCYPTPWCSAYASIFSHDVILREFLLDTLATVHMEHGYIVDRVISNLHKIAEDEVEKDNEDYVGKRYTQLSVRQQKDLGRLAYVVWDTLQAEHCPRSPDLLARLFNTTTQFMRMAEKELARQPAYSPLADYVPRLVAELNLPLWLSIAVEKASWHASHQLTDPEPFIGAVLLTAGMLLKTDMPGLDHMLTVSKIAALVNCTEHRLKQLQKRLPQEVTIELIKSIGAHSSAQSSAQKEIIKSKARELAVHQAGEVQKKAESHLSY